MRFDLSDDEWVLSDAPYEQVFISNNRECNILSPAIPYPLDRAVCRRSNTVERLFSRLKSWGRFATRYDCLLTMPFWPAPGSVDTRLS
jgi:transposase